ILFAVVAIAPFLAGAFTALVSGATGSSTLQVGNVGYNAIGYNLVLILAAVVAVWLGVVSYRQMDDRRGVPLRDDLSAAVGAPAGAPAPARPCPRGGAARGPRRCPGTPTARRRRSLTAGC